MKTKYLILGLGALVLVALALEVYSLVCTNDVTNTEKLPEQSVGKHAIMTFTLHGDIITLANGVYEAPSEPNSVMRTTVRYFGNELMKDLDGDGDTDSAFLVTEETGGSGTFYYAVVVLNDGGTYRGSDALFLGDRIAPQTTESGPANSFIVNYADRGPDEPMSATPTIGKSIRILLNPETMQLGEWVSDFEGETGRFGNPYSLPSDSTKLKADTFTGTLEDVDTGCFADGECFVVVDGKHVTVLMGWSRDIVGSVEGVQGFGDLESYLGSEVEVYAQVKGDGTYTLYGSEGFYVRLLSGGQSGSTGGGSAGGGYTGSPGIQVGDEPASPIAGGGCMVGGCSGQLCVDEKTGNDMVTTCEYRAEYACYANAVCTRQAGGECGWTMNETLRQCLQSAESEPRLEVN